MLTLPRLLLLVTALAAASCSQEPEAVATEWPEGTVLVVDGVEAVSAEDVDRWRGAILLAEPGRSLPAQRRLALTNIVLPGRVARLIDPAAREVARAEAEGLLEVLRAGKEADVADPEPEHFPEGNWKSLGLDIWFLALNAPLDEWQLFETVGAFTLFRAVSRDPEPWNHLSRVEVERIIFPYLDGMIAQELIQQGLDLMSLELVDEDWREVVPAEYLSRMGVSTRYQREDPPVER